MDEKVVWQSRCNNQPKNSYAGKDFRIWVPQKTPNCINIIWILTGRIIVQYNKGFIDILLAEI